MELRTADPTRVRPDTVEALSDVLVEATAAATPTAIWGGGTHRSYGQAADPSLVIETTAFDRIIEWEPDDLTVVVGAGMKVDELESTLADRGQSAVLPEVEPGATVGGVIAAGVSPFRRLRFGPTRDRILEVKAVTGDGRIIKGGGQVVKNVTGYDLPRLYVGSLGALGVITTVCLKLWPLTEAMATVRVESPAAAEDVYRPTAVIETNEEVTVLVAGTGREVEGAMARLGGEAVDGLRYPSRPTGATVWEARVRPRHLGEVIALVPDGVPFVAQHGVGVVAFGADTTFDISPLRGWVEARGGAVVRTGGGSAAQDPWGRPPTGLDLQERIVAAFDPARILESGRLPGGL